MLKETTNNSFIDFVNFYKKTFLKHTTKKNLWKVAIFFRVNLSLYYCSNLNLICVILIKKTKIIKLCWTLKQKKIKNSRV